MKITPWLKKILLPAGRYKISTVGKKRVCGWLVGLTMDDDFNEISKCFSSFR